jgi:PAS domain S-box-containing protein
MQKKENFILLKDAFNEKSELKKYLDLSIDMSCVCDLDGRIIYTNQSFNSLMGYDLNDLEHKLLLRLVYPNDLAKMISALSKYRKDKLPIRLFETRFLTKKGDLKWFSWNVVYDEINEVSFFSARDITEIHETREQLNLFNAAFDKAKEGIIIAKNIGTFEHPNPAIIYANQTFLDYSGYNLDDVIGKNPRMMRGTNDNAAVVEKIKYAMKNWKPVDVEVKNQTKYGEDIWVSLSISPIANEEGILTHWLSIQKDITERVNREEKLRMFESVVVNCKDSVIITAAGLLDYPNGPQIVFVNDAFCEMTGFTRAEAIGNTPRMLQGVLTSKETRLKIGNALKKWQPIQIDVLNYKKNKELFWVELSIVPVANEKGWFTHWVSIQRDITERVQLQEKLENKVAERTRELEQSNRKLEAFAWVVSHDLKAPLRMIVSYLEIFKRKFIQKIGEEAATIYKDEFDYLKFAQTGAKEAGDLIQGVLKYSQIKSATYEWQMLDLNRIVETVLVLLKDDIAKSKANVIYNDLPTVKGHKVQIKQLFQNLIANAIKFRGEHLCEIKIEVTKSKDGYIFEVRDNGIGMEEIDQKVIFNLFGRAKTIQKYEGQGIGLSLCKEIVEHHKGKIWVESSTGKGSSFFFGINT